MGIEPTSEAWEASILPLYDARSFQLPRLYLIAPPRENPRRAITARKKISSQPARRPNSHRTKLKSIHPRLDRWILSRKFLHLGRVLHLQHRDAKASRACHHGPINQNLRS